MDTILHEEGGVRSVLAATGISAGGLLLAELATFPAILADPTIATSPGTADRTVVVASFVLNFLGFFLAGGIYLVATGKGRNYLDLRVPTLREWGYALAGVVGSILFVMGVNVTVQLLDLPTAPNQVIEYVGDDPNMVLILIVIVFTLNAPAEEFLFRNVVQKRLYAAFTRWQAVGVASLIFALIHVPAYAVLAESSAAIGVSLAIVFGGAVIFGALYAKTDNLIVPIVAHASFNAFQFGILYLVLKYGDSSELESGFSSAFEVAASAPV